MNRTETVALEFDVDGTGPLLVAIHGLNENRHSWDPIPLDEHFRVIRVDLRGHGNSPEAAPYDMVTLAADVHAVVESVAPGELPLLVGHSIGAAVATAYAAACPARGVINIDQSLELASMQAGLQQAQAMLRGDGFSTFITNLHESLYGDLDPATIDRLRAIRNPKQDVVLGMWAPLLEMSPADFEKWSAGTTAVPATVPYLALHGRHPGPEYEAWLHRAVPSAKIEARDVDTHYVHLADPDWFLTRLIDFDAATTETEA